MMKVLLVLKGCTSGEEKEEGEEAMDIENQILETPSHGDVPLDSPYPYKCFKVNIDDPSTTLSSSLQTSCGHP